MPTPLGKSPSCWDGMARSFIPRSKQRKHPKEQSLAKLSFHIEVTDVRPPTELQTQCCDRYNTIRECDMTAVFDPDEKENKISRETLERLMQARTFREYPCESVCLEWICVPNCQPYRTTHRIVDVTEVKTISFYHNRCSDSLTQLSELELLLVRSALGSFISTPPGKSERIHNRVSTWLRGKSIRRVRAGLHQTPLAAIPLGDCNWLNSERWELVSRNTTRIEPAVSSLQSPSKAPGRHEFEPSGSRGKTRKEPQGYPEIQNSRELRDAPTSKLDQSREHNGKVTGPFLNGVPSGTTRGSRSGTQLECASRPISSTLIAGNQAYNDDSGNVYGVVSASDLGIENLPFPDEYWLWDEVKQNYYHDEIDVNGHRVKIWYPPEFD